MTLRAFPVYLGLFLLMALASSCRYDMQDQPKYLAFRGSEIFADSLSSRPLVEGTIARGYLREDAELYTGKYPAGHTAPSTVKTPGDSGAAVNTTEVNEFPFPITRQILDRGEERFNIYCSPCHGMAGDGHGMIVQRGFRQPPSYHDARLIKAPLGHFYDVITNGFGAMPDYSMQVPPHERWAIIAYIRALQLSQMGTVAEVPPAEMAKLK